MIDDDRLDNWSMDLQKKSTATSYHFVTSPRSYGWAICTINDESGELSVMSDWGHWSHRWSPQSSSLGAPSLTHFIAGRSPASYAYLADKLATYEERHCFDPEKTVESWRSLVIESRRHAEISAEIARRLWDDLGEVKSVDNVDDFVRRFWDIDNHDVLFSDHPCNHLRTSPTGAYRVLLERIIPALVAACTAAVEGPCPRKLPCLSIATRASEWGWGWAREALGLAGWERSRFNQA